MTSNRLFWGASAAVLALAGGWAFAPNAHAAAAAAEAATAEASPGPASLEEIIVVARRREENIQSVPTAVTAVSGEQLRAKNIETTRDLALTTPSLNVSGSFTSTFLNFSMRGNIPNASSFGANDPTVQTYFNEVAPIYPSTAQFFDIASVNVLRGPQGTLFGRSAIGGAILFVPERPSFSYGGYIEGQVGNYNDREAIGAVNVPIIADKLAVRLAGQIVRRDGYTKILNLNNFDLDQKRYEAFRGSILAKPIPELENYTVVNYSDINQHAGSFFLFDAEPTRIASLLARPSNPGYAAFLAANPDLAAIPGVSGGLQSYLATVQALGARRLYTNVQANNLVYRERVKFVSNTTTLETPIATLKNILAYQKLNQSGPYDPDGSPLPILDTASLFGNNFLQNMHQWSEEIQAQGKRFNNKLEWVVGYYWQNNKDDFPGGSFGSVAFPFAAAIGTARQTLNARDITSKAVYAHAVWNFTDKLDLTLGARRTWDDQTVQSYVAAAAANSRGIVTGPTQCGLDRTKLFDLSQPGCHGVKSVIHDKGIGWVASLDYKPTDRSLIYFSSRRGYQPAGVNTNTTVPGLITFGQAQMTDYELGGKFEGAIGGAPFRFNSAAFYENINGAHRSGGFIDPRTGALTSIILNAQKVQVKGFETEFEIVFNPYVRLSAFGDYTDGKNKSFSAPVVTLNPNDPNCANAATRATCSVIITGSVDLSGNPVPYLPKSHYGATVQFTLPTSDRVGVVTFSATYYHQDAFTFVADLRDGPTARAGAQNLLNLRAAWENPFGSPIQLSAFVRNATNQVYRTGGVGIQPQLGITYGSYGEPRMYGLQLRYRFGAGK